MNKYAYFLFFPFHIILIAGLIGHWSNFQWWHGLLLFIVWTLFSGFGIGAGFHRLLAHQAYKTTKFWERTLSILGCFGLQGSPLFWVSVHRASHHPFADTPKDEHTPRKGWLHAFIGWPLTIDMNHISARQTRDLISDNWQVKLHKRYFFLVVGTIAAMSVIAPTITALCFLPAIAITLYQEFCVNLFCHIRGFGGYRNFETPDDTVNRPLLGLLWGVGYHNNHHRSPASIDFGFHKWYEIDFTKYIVRMIRTDG